MQRLISSSLLYIVRANMTFNWLLALLCTCCFVFTSVPCFTAQPFLDFLRAGTAAMKEGLAHLGESPTPGQHPASAVARAAQSSQSSTPRASAAPGGTQQLSSAGAAPVAEHASTVRQQLAGLKLAMFQTVQALAGRVQTGGELCEVVTGVLHAVAAELHCQGHSSPTRLSSSGGAAAAVASAAANGPVGEFGSSPFELAAAGGAPVSTTGTGARDGSLSTKSTDSAKLAEAGMALQLAAAAAEGCLGEQDDAFVTPISSFTGTALAGAGTASANGGTGRGLPGGMLPAKLVSAALPLLTRAPLVVRHAVQRILLTLLPAAPQVSKQYTMHYVSCPEFVQLCCCSCSMFFLRLCGYTGSGIKHASSVLASPNCECTAGWPLSVTF